MGAGQGLNFAHYPDTVTKVIAIEPEPTLRAHAIDAAAEVDQFGFSPQRLVPPTAHVLGRAIRR